jgi:pimeloyl-ACP methyl ester carboxylesterase
VTQVVKAADGRRLAVDVSGKPDGTSVFLLHGTPGSRNGPRPRGIVLYRLGVRLISYDRPGYGGSDPHPGRTVADAAGDVAAIAEFLDIDQFAIVGRSGGAPHALACAALLPSRVSSVAALASVAPVDAPDLDWCDGMTGSNLKAYRDAGAEEGVAAELAQRARQVRSDPESLLNSLWPELASYDLKVVGDVALRRILAETYAEALQESASGWIDDVLALRRPWGFDPSAIATPAMLWHGGNDRFSPVSHTRWLANQINGSMLDVPSDAAHFSAVTILPEILKWIVTSPTSADSAGQAGPGQAELPPDASVAASMQPTAAGPGLRMAAGQ